ncbi:MAG: YncE family protein [Planctomycetota bacterium]
MRTTSCLLVTTLLAPLGAQEDKTAPTDPLVLRATIPMPGVPGRLDHLALDRARHRLLVAALVHGSVQVIDLEHARVSDRVAGLEEPQGILYLDDVDRVVVACGGSGSVEVLRGDDLHPIATVKVDDDADNLRYDRERKLVWVACGHGALTAIDAAKWTVVGSIALDAHPEGFQLDVDGQRAFVNLPDARSIAVCDLRKMNLADRWRLREARGNFPLALFDDGKAGAWIATGCRTPGKLLMRAKTDGTAATAIDLAGDVDDLAVDPRRRRIYAACGEGVVDVFVRDGATLTERARVPTAPGARTALFDADLDRLFVAAPRRGEQDARILVFTPQDDPPAKTGR